MNPFTYFGIKEIKKQQTEHHERSAITRSHLSSKIFTASVNSTSGGKDPVDSMVTEGRTNEKLDCYKEGNQTIMVSITDYLHMK